MGFFDNWKKKREEKARLREEQAAALAKKREEDAKNTAILLAVNIRITNSSLRDTERERTRQLSSHYHDEVIRRIGALAQAMMRATTDIGSSQLTRQFLATPYGGTGEPGDFAIFCVYVSSVIKNCGELLEASRNRKANPLEGKDGAITVSHQEIVTGMDTTLAVSLMRAEWMLSERRDLLGDHIGGLLVSAVNHQGLRFAGPIASKALERLRSSCPT
jgi:hypothetical protein